MALEMENQQTIPNVIYTGVGKVNAAYMLTKMLAKQQYDVVINLGTAGSHKFQRGELIASNQFIERDMDVTALGFSAYQTPFDKCDIIIQHQQIFTKLPHGICYSGDNFEIRQKNYDVIDMEAYAMAKICHLEKIPFASIKYITDGANESAAIDWQGNLNNASAKLAEFYHQHICN